MRQRLEDSSSMAIVVNYEKSHKLSSAQILKPDYRAGCVDDWEKSASCFRTSSVCSWPRLPTLSVRWAPHLRALLDSDHLPLTSVASFLFDGPCRDLAHDPQYYVFLIRIIAESSSVLTQLRSLIRFSSPTPYPLDICVPGKYGRQNACFLANELAPGVLYSRKYLVTRSFITLRKLATVHNSQ